MTSINGNHMPIKPSELAENTWDIKLCIKVGSELRCIKEEFVGSIREAMSYEAQLRGLVKDGSIGLKHFRD